MYGLEDLPSELLFKTNLGRKRVHHIRLVKNHVCLNTTHQIRHRLRILLPSVGSQYRSRELSLTSKVAPLKTEKLGDFFLKLTHSCTGYNLFWKRIPLIHNSLREEVLSTVQGESVLFLI